MRLDGLCVVVERRGIGRCCAGGDLFRDWVGWVVRGGLRVLVLGGLVVRTGDLLVVQLAWVVEAEVLDCFEVCMGD
jgi:hypothetical protein